VKPRWPLTLSLAKGHDAVPEFILASESPRRRDLLARLGLHFRVVPAGIDEAALLDGGRPQRLARRLARAKAEAVARDNPHAVVLAADTLVILRGQVLGKPTAAADAKRMLAGLRGRRHRVVTGVTLQLPHGRRPLLQHVTTTVRMRSYSDGEIEAYVRSGAPFDKAGAYAIQNAAFDPVEAYEGCYCNVVGLPLWTVLRLLQSAEIAVAGERMPAACAACPLRPFA